jgi:hypothetical protein
MSFSDLDPVEEYLGKPVTAMTDQELVSYIKVYARAVHDIDLPVQGTPERSVMAGLKRTYGPANAGKLVKWACRESIGGTEPVGYFDFSKGRKWWTDRTWTALQQHIRKESAVKNTASQAEVGWGTLRHA